MRLWYDLHLHSCLSPCGDAAATPGNLAGMLRLAGVGLAALTDHNSCGNCAAFLKHAAAHGIVALPGMELTTAEEVHVLCLFAELAQAEDFSALVYASLPDVPNEPGIFGSQLLVDGDDEIRAEEPRLLLSATSIGVYDVAALVRTRGGVAFPAHIDRASFSLLSNLGLWDDAMGFTFYERTAGADPAGLPDRPSIVGSDAHRLEDIPDAAYALELDEPTARAAIEALRRLQ